MSSLSFRNSPRRNWLIYGLIAALVIIGLLLPPISLAERMGLTCTGTTLNARTPATTTPDGLTLALSDPAQSLTVKTQSIDQAVFDASQAGDDLKAAREAQPVNLLMRSPLYRIEACNSGPVAASLAINLPSNTQPNETFDLYAWDGHTWSWLGAYLDTTSNTVSAQVDRLPKTVALFQTTSVAPYVAAQIVPGQAIPADAVPLLNEVYIAGWSVADDGSILAEAGALPDTGNAKLFPIVRSIDPAPIRTVLASEEGVKAHLAELTNLAARSSFAGVAIDYRGLPVEYRADFTRFVQQLAQSVHAQNKKLAVVLPAPAIDANGAPDTAGYDWVAIGAAADIVQSDFGKDPANYLPGQIAQALAEWAPTQVSRYKFQPYVSIASLNAQAGAAPSEVSFADAIKPLGQLALSGPLSVTAGTSVTLQLDNPLKVSDYNFDPTTLTYRFTFEDQGQQHAVMVNTAASLAQRLGVLLPQHLRGVVITGLSGDVLPLALNQALTGYRQQAVPTNLSTALDMTWVFSANGKEVTRATRPITDTTLIWTAPDEPGTYNVMAMIGTQSKGSGTIVVSSRVTDTITDTTVTAGIAGSSTITTTATVGAPCLSGKYVADVTVPDGTKFKNGEKFTKTWKLVNDGSCNWPDDTELAYVSGTKLGDTASVKVGKVLSGTQVDVSVELTAPDQYGNYTGLWQLKSAQGNFGQQVSVVIVAGDPPAGSNVPAAAPPPVTGPIVGGSFEIGGHIADYRGVDLMKRAGMRWVKVQTFAGGDAASIINEAHAQGFKVLLGVLGDKGSVMSPSYQDEYARSVASMAAAGADAIEVWNEPNIDREWPNGQVNGGNYTQLLAKAYNAIKAANPGTLVISAALAPTGWWGAAGCGPDGCNDDTFLAQMAAAGAVNYMDCVGAHHNSGATSPSATSGHPADQSGHYSWYFLPTLNLYYNAFGGARKVCFTEFGYLSPEGFPSLESTAPTFAWAKNVTVAQQAAWLAEAAAMSANSGKVRMMIIWNVNFTNYGSDPMAGYAIIRPNGGCPACDALGNVVGSR